MLDFNNYGEALLAFENAWRLHLQEEGITDPEMVRSRIIRARLKGLTNTERMPTVEEIEAFKKQKHLWMAARVFDRFGYDAYLGYCGWHDLMAENGPGHEPCKANDKQCHMDCWKFGEC